MGNVKGGNVHAHEFHDEQCRGCNNEVSSFKYVDGVYEDDPLSKREGKATIRK